MITCKKRPNSALALTAVVVAGALLISGVPGCKQPGAASSSSAADGAQKDAGYQVTATVGMVTDIVQAVAGPRATVHGLIGSGIDPHLYKPTRSDVAALHEADVIFYSGLNLEGKMGDVLAKVGKSGKPVQAVTEGLDPAYLLSPAGAHGHHDPHVWMDVQAWSGCVEVVARALADYDPDHAVEYRARAETYRAQLAELDAYAKRVLGSVPEPQRVLITAHDAFNYFGRAYGMEVIGIQGISTESEAGLDDINRLVDLLVERQVRAVFVESSVADKNVRALLEGAAARDWTVTIGGELYSDAMGSAGTYEGTYVGMIDHNVTTIARALGGEAPATGLQGKLAGGTGYVEP